MSNKPSNARVDFTAGYMAAVDKYRYLGYPETPDKENEYLAEYLEEADKAGQDYAEILAHSDPKIRQAVYEAAYEAAHDKAKTLGLSTSEAHRLADDVTDVP